MAASAKRLGLVALAMTAVLVMPAIAAAQFNPYVMPQFNPAGPAALTPTNLPSSVSPSYLGPYDPLNYTPYNPYSYGIGPVGGALIGLADLYRASGTLVMNVEQSRSLRQQAIQAKLDTQRKRFELEMYIRANTPTFTEEQTKVARNTLKRIHSHSMPGEIASGKALNLMLDDARKFPSRKVASEQITLSEDILSQLNVSASHVGLGVLRNDGRISWPLSVQEVLTPEQMKTLEVQAQAVAQGALKGKIDPNVFRDFGAELDRTYENVVKRVNEIAGPHYLETKRFLNDLKDARTALDKGEAQRQLQYQKFVAGGKSVQEVVDFMISKGLTFAPATAQDEAAYRAFYSALVAFDVALNTQAPAPIEPKENR
jgi:hypothetical protein